MIKNVHRLALENPNPNIVGSELTTVNGDYEYWHYNCDDFNDEGWGCGYRTMQTIISWINHNLGLKSVNV